MPQVRQRSRKACHSCHQRKRKCDREEPCTTCSKYGYTCGYTTKDCGTNEGTLVSEQHRSGSITCDTDAFAASVLPLSRQSTTPVMRAVLELSKSRFVNASSAIAFPMILAKDLDARSSPRLHSYAWNAGTRNEPASDVGPSIIGLVSYDQVVIYSKMYFEHVNPVFGTLDQDSFNLKRDRHWSGVLQSSGFEAIICGVCALGSLLAGPNGCTAETKLVAHAKHILDTNSVIHPVSYDHVASWILRALYLRLTTRPHASWMASAIALHICEAIGLHRELMTVQVASQQPAICSLEAKDLELRRRTFWVAWAVNHLFSYEYGRTPTSIEGITCLDPSTLVNEHTHHFVQLVKTLCKGLSDVPCDPTDTLTKLLSYSDRHALITLQSASASFCIFRNLKSRGEKITKEQEQKVIAIGKSGLAAARTLIADGLCWWDVLGVPFNFVCILLAANHSESLALLAQAMQALRHSTGYLQTHMAEEALKTARSLIQAAAEKKQRDLDFLCAELPKLGTSAINEPDMSSYIPDMYVQEDLMTEWWAGGQVDTDMFVNELLSQPLG